MATRDESHLFSLAALTTRSPAASPPHPPPLRAPQTSDLELTPTPEPAPMISAGWSILPLGAPLGSVEPAPTAGSTRSGHGYGHTVALVVAASLLGAGIVAAAAWSSDPAASPATLGPEIPTETLARPALEAPTPITPTSPAAAPAPPEALAPAAIASAAAMSKPPPIPQRPPRHGVRPPVQPPRNRGVTAPAPPPARGPCAHCSPGDLACNIKCRAG